MKKLLFIIAVLILLVIPINPTWAQDTADPVDNLIFGGVRYDDGLHLSAGYGKQLSGQLWTLQYTNLGFDYGSWNSEIVYFFRPSDNLYIGPLAGADADWINAAEDTPIVTYVVGATGVIAAYDLNDVVGFWGYFKYKFSVEADNAYMDGTSFGAGLHLWF